jgi:hypothetical protein
VPALPPLLVLIQFGIVEAPFAALEGQQHIAKIRWDIHQTKDDERAIIEQGSHDGI